MGGLILVRAARALGLSVTAKDGRLLIRGPKAAGSVAMALISSKSEVLAALAEVAAQRTRLEWPEHARRAFLEHLGKDSAARFSVTPGSDTWALAVRAALRAAAGMPSVKVGDPTTLVDEALVAFAGLGGLTVARVGKRAELGFPESDPVLALNDRACPCCYRSCWWSLNPNAVLLTCGYCHPAAPHLNVTWHTRSRRDQDLELSRGAS